MSILSKAYASGMAEVLETSGFSKRASLRAADTIAEMKKKAAMFNFGDSPYSDSGNGISLSSIIVPLLAAAAAGYIGYNARDKGYASRSAFDNVKNYAIGTFDKYIRKSRPRPIYDFKRYLED